MDDERLASELERRARAASPGLDWARHDLLPAVSREIDARPQPVVTSRWSPRLGVAAVVAALLIMVLAVPRMVPMPPSSSASPNESASPEPAQTGVLSTAEFASRIAAGELNGETVLVDGRIGGGLRLGPMCGPVNGLQSRCYLGQLDGADPPVEVWSGWTATIEDGGTCCGSIWKWWHFPDGPSSGILVLSVTKADQVELVGVARASGVGPTWSTADASALDINSVDVDEVVLVRAWLVETEPPGTTINIDCASPSFPRVDGLPYDYCQPHDYLSSVEVVGRTFPPDGAAQLSVQRNAAQLFGARIQDGTSLFAIAPRLYGGCFDTPTCWQWDVVARVDANLAAAPTPSPSRILPPASLHDCGSISNEYFDPSPVFVVDGARAVDSCTAEPRQGKWPAEDANVIVQPIGDATNEIEVAWRTDVCNPERVLIELKSTSAGYAIRVILDRNGLDGYECIGISQPPEHAVLALTAPIDPAHVSVELVIEPDLHADLPRTFDCTAAEPAVGGLSAPGRVPRIVDHTGVVTGCTQLEAGAPASGVVDVRNRNGFDSIRFDWVDTTCEGPIEADFKGVAGGYELAVQQPSEPCLTGGPIAIAVDYLIPMLSELVAADLVGPPPEFACADTPYVTVVDEAGVVRSCAASESAAAPEEGDLVIENPGGDTSVLQLSWVGSQCSYEVHLRERSPYSIDIYTPCRHAAVVHTVTLHLTTPIGADQITGWSIGGPPQPSPISCQWQGWLDPAASDRSPEPIPSNLPPPPTFVDLTGLVSECAASDRPLDNFPIPVLDDVNDPVDMQYHINWTANRCDTFSRVTFARVGNRYEMKLDIARTTGTCNFVASRRIAIRLSQPVDISQIDLILPPS